MSKLRITENLRGRCTCKYIHVCNKKNQFLIIQVARYAVWCKSSPFFPHLFSMKITSMIVHSRYFCSVLVVKAREEFILKFFSRCTVFTRASDLRHGRGDQTLRLTRPVYHNSLKRPDVTRARCSPRPTKNECSNNNKKKKEGSV